MMPPTTVFDCFSGLGGFSLGAQLAGCEVIGGVDADADAVNVFAQIFPDAQALKHDLLEEKPRAILRKSGIVRGDVDILVGGPPCQPYSVNNHQRSTQDARCGLVARYLEFVTTLRPAWLVIENVPGFAYIEGGTFLRTLLRSLRARGYAADFVFVDAAMFGVPQRRRRLVILASREHKELSKALEAVRNRRSKVLTVGQAIGDLPENPSPEASYCGPALSAFRKTMRDEAPKNVKSHMGAGLGTKNLRRIGHVPPGGNWRDIPRRLLPPGMKRAGLSDHTTRYGRLHEGRPAFTLLTKCDPHWGCFVHPVQNRVITIREAARLQSIADRVPFPDSLTTSYRLIGNAVPPLLAKGILEILK
ncbi:MAG: DNA cytosine methyltransferase [Verrucomicrobia bacterium]|nr:DNA cytosine methyltransferase [Verrucomicrobiota bacterium]